MQITSYQMRNVLACYGKKLSRTRMPGAQPGMIAEQLAISPETTRRATMDKISQQLLEKIADVLALQPAQESPPEPAAGQPAAWPGDRQMSTQDRTGYETGSHRV